MTNSYEESVIEMNMKTSIYVCTLPKTKQLSIFAALKSKGISQSDIERAMNSRLCDLSDTLDSEEICYAIKN